MGGIGLVSYLVDEYEDAKRYFTESLGFELREDSPLPGGKRWLVVAPPGGQGAGLLLAQAGSPEQKACIGQQGGGRVWLFWETEDFARDHAHLEAQGVRFLEAPRHESYGSVAVFEDRYGNRWDLIQKANKPPA